MFTTKHLFLTCLVSLAACGTGSLGAASMGSSNAGGGFVEIVACKGDVETVKGDPTHVTYRIGIEASGDKMITAMFNGFGATTFYANGDDTSEAKSAEISTPVFTATLPTESGAIVRCVSADNCGTAGTAGLTGWPITCTSTKY